ncbi:Spo0E family sporulation regulatory protein-aspartic acid phosphatase [Salinibacillus xinjiangensis]|uniref:Spo0E family sporulation regulatory protein-aspartic acid phosphatase n=2 Tax=Salinibacillus xinjiangensis TaxID=1229268 RepID=A0A6G1X3X9_9BACI|nr:Spo0E family sporulation regulatory protein-aspartic acid phosphatase [Salinibacillus xinjiangensis]
MLKLKREIELVRSKMIEVASVNGFTSKESIQISRKLDTLLNMYQMVLENRTKT